MLKLVLASLAASVAAAPALAEPLAYAANDRGAIGAAAGFGSIEAAGRQAVEWCGGAAAGCHVVMAVEGDCMAFAESETAAGYWYYVGYTVAENGYDRSGELRRVQDMVLGWCNGGDAPADTCEVTPYCASYIRNLN